MIKGKINSKKFYNIYLQMKFPCNFFFKFKVKNLFTNIFVVLSNSSSSRRRLFELKLIFVHVLITIIITIIIKILFISVRIIKRILILSQVEKRDLWK